MLVSKKKTKFYRTKCMFGIKIRVVKTASKAQTVQVIRFQNNKRIVLRHIGSAHTEEALSGLLILADQRLKGNTSQLSIFPNENPNKLLHLNHNTFNGVNLPSIALFNEKDGIKIIKKLY